MKAKTYAQCPTGIHSTGDRQCVNHPSGWKGGAKARDAWQMRYERERRLGDQLCHLSHDQLSQVEELVNRLRFFAVPA